MIEFQLWWTVPAYLLAVWLAWDIILLMEHMASFWPYPVCDKRGHPIRLDGEPT